MKKFNLAYGVAFAIVIVLLFCMAFDMDDSVTFYGFAENKETEINMENSTEIKRIHVTTGQKVKKGTVLLDVVSSDLSVQISSTNYQIEELQTKYQLWKSDLDWRISQYKLELNEKTSKIQAEIDQYKAQLEQNIKLVASMDKGIASNTKLGTTSNPITLKIKALTKERNYARSIINTEISKLESERFADNNPLLSQIKSLEREQEYYETKKESQTIVAPADGLVGSIQCKANENIPSFQTLITFYDESPTLVIGYIHEEHMLKVNVNDTISIFSTTRPGIENIGIVRTRGSRIIEIPPRLRKIKELITYGREIIIEIPPDNPFLQKEKVTLNLRS
jgi:multidrug resistance efflux pump